VGNLAMCSSIRPIQATSALLPALSLRDFQTLISSFAVGFSAQIAQARALPLRPFQVAFPVMIRHFASVSSSLQQR
jgi:hypothetical protein